MRWGGGGQKELSPERGSTSVGEIAVQGMWIQGIQEMGVYGGGWDAVQFGSIQDWQAWQPIRKRGPPQVWAVASWLTGRPRPEWSCVFQKPKVGPEEKIHQGRNDGRGESL